MTPQELKNSILQLAIQGRLVEQRPEEGTAQELYHQIQAEKRRLIKEGKIKKEKPLPEIAEDEKPFEIPESWTWVRLRNIVFNRGQLTPQHTFSYIDIGSIDNQRQLLNTNENIIEPDKAPSRARKIVEQGDILYSTVRPYLHNMCIVDKQFSHTPIASTGFAVLSCYPGIFNKYLFYYLMAPSFDSYANSSENAKGVAYPAINDDRLYRAVIPLPPLAEQKRIVAKIDELLPLIDRYEAAWTRLEDFNRRFPEDMKKSILQQAIQGKLVEQRPEEGAAQELYQQIQREKQRLIKEGKIKKERPLPEITEDEKPFEIPESWCWIRFGDMGSYKKGPFGSALTKSIFVPRGAETVKVYEQKNAIQKNATLGEYYISREYFDTKMKDFEVHPGDIIISCAGTIGEAYVLPEDMEQGIINQALMRMRLFSPVFVPYFLLFFDVVLKQDARSGSKGSAIKNIPPFDILKKYLVPLPPLAEQKRIVARLEELLPLCERLK